MVSTPKGSVCYPEKKGPRLGVLGILKDQEREYHGRTDWSGVGWWDHQRGTGCNHIAILHAMHRVHSPKWSVCIKLISSGYKELCGWGCRKTVKNEMIKTKALYIYIWTHYICNEFKQLPGCSKQFAANRLKLDTENRDATAVIQIRQGTRAQNSKISHI